MSFSNATGIVHLRKVGDAHIVAGDDERRFAVRKRPLTTLYEVFASNDEGEVLGKSLFTSLSYPAALKALATELRAGTI